MDAFRAVFLFGLVFFLLIFYSYGAKVITVDVHAAKNLLSQDHIYLDVRTEEEFKNGHLENALNIPYMFTTPKGMMKNPQFMDQVRSLCNKDDQIIVGCKSGVRSVYATTDLLNAEYKNVYNMGGGYIAWIDNGFTVKNPNPHSPEEL